MKTLKFFILIIALTISFGTSAQIRTSGEVSININLPFPEIVINKRKPTPRVEIPSEPRPVVIHNSDHSSNHYHGAYGTINNQNTRNGRYVYEVINASVNPLPRNQELVSFKLDNGEILELIIATANPNDYNYHYNNRPHNQHIRRHNNVIISVILNGKELPLRDGSLSLQPKQHAGFHTVVNLHSIHEGDFNGTVNM